LAVAAPEIRSYKDLTGKVLAISSPGSSEDFAVKLLLKREQIALSDVQIIPLGPASRRTEALVAGQAHFSPLNPDLAVQIEPSGFNILGHFRDLLPVPWGGFSVHQDTLREQPELVKAWLRASIRAVQFVKRNQDAAAEI